MILIRYQSLEWKNNLVKHDVDHELIKHVHLQQFSFHVVLREVVDDDDALERADLYFHLVDFVLN
jgi:hypothetical protein